MGEIRDRLCRDFDNESIDIELGLQKGDIRQVERGIFGIYRKYKQQENQLSKLPGENDQLRTEVEQLKRENHQIKEELEQTREKLKQAEGAKSSPAERKDLSNAALYHIYKQNDSFRATGKLFNCEGKTVKARLIKAGYIKK